MAAHQPGFRKIGMLIRCPELTVLQGDLTTTENAMVAFQNAYSDVLMFRDVTSKTQAYTDAVKGYLDKAHLETASNLLRALEPALTQFLERLRLEFPAADLGSCDQVERKSLFDYITSSKNDIPSWQLRLDSNLASYET